MNVKANKNAFTLIELLVAISIITILLTSLMPSFYKAREQARLSVCAVQLKSISTLMTTYVLDNKDYLPGTNTSGVAVRTLINSPISSFQKSKLPIQPQDWATPILRAEMELPQSRAKRLDIVNRQFSCPSLQQEQIEFYGEPADRPDFETHLSRGSSYLMPLPFQLWGTRHEGTMITRNVPAITGSHRWEAYSFTYQSKIGQVGNPSEKIMLADGSRYVNERGIQTEDINLLPPFYGSFASGGAWASSSDEYGPGNNSENWDGSEVATWSASRGQNLSHSYRHKNRIHSLDAQNNPGLINTLFFDGHIESLNDQKSRNIDYWYPKGSIVNRREYVDGLGMTNVPYRYTIN